MGLLPSAYVLLADFSPMYYAHPDLADTYGSRLLIATLVLGIGLTLYSLIRYRGRTENPLAWVLLSLSVVVFPTAAMLVGTPLLFERAERVEFCSSCHAAMNPYVADMHDPGSASLAAIHFRNRYIPENQCYVCHTSFGLFGTVQARVAGVKDVGKFYFNTYTHPLRMREPYGNGECLKCHGESLRWNRRHPSVRDSVFAGESRCLGCHGRAHVLN